MRTALTPLAFILLFINLNAQEDLTKDNANSVITKCLKSIAENDASDSAYLELAEAYYLLGEMKNAAKWYKYGLVFQEFKLPRYYKNYANALEAINEDVKAVEMYKKAESLKDELAIPKLYTVDNAYKVTPLKINSEQMDFAPSFYGGNLVFSSARMDTGGVKNSIDRWTGEPYKNLYHVPVTDKGMKDKEISQFSIEGSKALHGSTTVFSKDKKTVYFTKEIYSDRKRGGNKSLFKIYQARLENGKWKNVVELPFNTDHYSSAHPALSPDGKVLYFVSDRVGSYGVSDIWQVKVFDNGKSFGLPEKLGPNINTKGKDSFPFVSASGKLYFSSDGHQGHGGMDVFVADITNTPIDKVQIKNLGKPINSAADDITFIINENTKKGYFSSNRKEGAGRDDIYGFLEIKSEVAVE